MTPNVNIKQMKLIDSPLTKVDFDALATEFGPYFKVTVDIENKRLVAGPILHADGEEVLLAKGSRQDSIWGGGVLVSTLEVDANAVLNIRPRLGNNGTELSNATRREEFFSAVNELLFSLWK